MAVRTMLHRFARAAERARDEIVTVDTVAEDLRERDAVAAACSRPVSFSGISVWPCSRHSAFQSVCP